MAGTPLKVAFLCSRRAPGLVRLLNEDSSRGERYEIVCCVSSENTFPEDVVLAARRDFPCLSHSIRAFSVSYGVACSDLIARRDYDKATLALLQPYEPDLILLDGYLLVLTEPMLKAFDGRIINVHHSDLTLLNERGRPKYPGLRAVRDAIDSGELDTRATAHIVTEAVDEGPVLLRSWSFPVCQSALWAREQDDTDLLRAAAWIHERWMLREAWGPMLASSIELAAAAMRDTREPLDIQAVGRWLLTADGQLVPDGIFASV